MKHALVIGWRGVKPQGSRALAFVPLFLKGIHCCEDLANQLQIPRTAQGIVAVNFWQHSEHPANMADESA